MIHYRTKLIKKFTNRVLTKSEGNSNLISSKDVNFHDFKSISKASEKLVEGIDPIKEIRGMVNQYPQDAMQMRFLGLTKYKTSLFLDRELQQELLLEGGLASSKINNQILNDNFIYNEDKSNNLFLHKKIQNYYVLVHFRYLKPNKDRKKILDFKSDLIKEQYNKFGITTGMLHKLTGAEDNPDYLKAKNEDLIDMGAKDDDEYPKDLTPFYFNINLINKSSECLQFRCFSEETKISIGNVKFYNFELTSSFAFLKNLEKSKDDYDTQREDILKLTKNHKSINYLNKVFSNWDPYNPYGPDFYTLNKHLQQQIVDLLNKLEVTADISNYIRYLGLNRERREYVGWLFKLNKFLNK